jgi:outer membrane protein OmpA-like peptidoglycan-associated protein
MGRGASSFGPNRPFDGWRGPRHITELTRRGVAVATKLFAATLAVSLLAGLTTAGADPTEGTGPAPVIVFASPAVGSNGSYSVTTTYGAPFSIPAVSDGVSGDTFTFSATSGTAGCSISSNGGNFTYTSAGSCVVTAQTLSDSDDSSDGGVSGNREGSSSDGTLVTGTLAITINPTNQTISVSSGSAPVGSPVAVSASGYSGTGTITFSLDGGTASGCALSGNSVTATSAGTCLVKASIAADTDYNAATSTVDGVETFSLLSQSISVSSGSAPVGTPITLSASGYSGTGTITFSLDGGTASGCALSGNSVTATSAGTCLVKASIAADGVYVGATSTDGTETFTRLSQTISVSSGSAPVGTPITLSASGSSGTGTISFGLDSGGTAVGCSVGGGQVSAQTAGTCLVYATIAQDGVYSSAQSSDATETFTHVVQSISVSSGSAPVGGSISVSASGYSGTGTISFSLDGGTASGCALSGSSVTATSAGTCLVSASIAQDSIYASATSSDGVETFYALGTLLITAQSATISAGTSYTPSVAVSGLASGDSALVNTVAYFFTGLGSTTYSSSSVPTAVGTYLVTPSSAAVTISPSAHQGDYTLPYSYAPGVLTIQGGPLTVVASSETINVGQTPNITTTVTGLAPGDTAVANPVTLTYEGTGSTSYGPSTTAPAVAGTYSVTPSDATVTVSPGTDQGLYSTTYLYQAGQLTIVAAGHLTVSVADISATAGDPISPVTQVSGLITGDSAVINSVTVTYSGQGSTTYGPSTTPPTQSGTYLMTPSAATVTITPGSHQVNYTQPYAYVAGNLLLAPAAITPPAKPPLPTRTFVVKSFAEGSSALTKKLKTQVAHLAALIKRLGYHQVQLAGFTDNVFTPAFNALVIQLRAAAVQRQLLADLAALKVTGVSVTIVPGATITLVSANSTPQSRALNRRVVATLKGK